MQHQMQSIAQLDDTDRQIRGEIRGEMSSEYLKRLKEARTVYREDLIDCVRKCTWYVFGFDHEAMQWLSVSCYMGDWACESAVNLNNRLAIMRGSAGTV